MTYYKIDWLLDERKKWLKTQIMNNKGELFYSFRYQIDITGVDPDKIIGVEIFDHELDVNYYNKWERLYKHQIIVDRHALYNENLSGRFLFNWCKNNINDDNWSLVPVLNEKNFELEFMFTTDSEINATAFKLRWL